MSFVGAAIGGLAAGAAGAGVSSLMGGGGGGGSIHTVDNRLPEEIEAIKSGATQATYLQKKLQEEFEKFINSGGDLSEVAPWLQGHIQSSKDYGKQNLHDTFFGKAGYGPNLADLTMSAGAMSGMGQRPVMAGVNKLTSDYGKGVAGINQWGADTGANWLTNYHSRAPNQMIAARYTSGNQPQNIMQQPQEQSNPWGDMLGGVAGDFMKNLSFGKGQSGFAVPGMGGYGLGTPIGTYNTGSMSILPKR